MKSYVCLNLFELFTIYAFKMIVINTVLWKIDTNVVQLL